MFSPWRLDSCSDYNARAHQRGGHDPGMALHGPSSGYALKLKGAISSHILYGRSCRGSSDIEVRFGWPSFKKLSYESPIFL